MPTLSNPFSGKTTENITKEDIINAIRQNIAGELDAIYGYDSVINAINDNIPNGEFIKKVLSDIRDEEITHTGELQILLAHLDPNYTTLIEKGKQEALEIKNNNLTDDLIDDDFIEEDEIYE